MFEARLWLIGLLGGGAIGIAVLASPAMNDFVQGLFGISSGSTAGNDGPIKLRADSAAPSLANPLQAEELKELLQGLVAFVQGDYSKAVPIAGKYALLGDSRAQGAVGSMYYFGLGLPLDRQEGIRWFSLAAAQGSQSDRETLAAAISGTLEWERSEVDTAFADARGEQTTPQYEPGASAQQRSYGDTAVGVGGSYDTGAIPQGNPLMGAHGSIEGTESASRRHLEGLLNQPQVGSSSPVILNPAGPRTYSDGNGGIYTQAGPHGVVNTETGEFSPVN